MGGGMPPGMGAPGGGPPGGLDLNAMMQQMMGGGAGGKIKMPPGMPKSMMRMGKR